MNFSVLGKRRRLLIVQEDEIQSLQLAQYFEVRGFQVTVLTTATEAIEIFQSKRQDWDFLITDYEMSGLNGSDLIIWCSIWKVRFKKTILFSSRLVKSRSEQLMNDFGVTVAEKNAPMRALYGFLSANVTVT